MVSAQPLIKQGWLRALLYVIAIFAALIFFGILGKILSAQVQTKEEASAGSSIESFIVSYATISLGIFAVTWLFRKLVDRQTLHSLGFQWKGFRNEAWMGFFTGTSMLGIGSLILVATGYLTFIGVDFSAYPFVFELLALILVAFIEELLFRGYLLNNLLQSMNKWIALVITAVLFSLFHGANPGISILAFINILTAGVLLGINYIYTRNLWFSILFHFSWNFFQGPILGYDVSGLQLQSIFKQSLNGPEIFTGGPFGFEGSILCAILLAVVILILGYIFSKRYSSVAVETLALNNIAENTLNQKG